MWYLTLLLLLFLRPPFAFQKAINTTPSREKTVDFNGTTLGAGEPCGVYTLRCGPGLRCVPPEKDPKPIRALLEGRGWCGNTSSSVNATEASHAADTAPTEVPEEAPCRKLLTALIKELGSQPFKSHHEIYLPNCDRDGFYKKRQCWSSRGRQRGKCWCVDENGTPLPTDTTQKSTSLC